MKIHTQPAERPQNKTGNTVRAYDIGAYETPVVVLQQRFLLFVPGQKARRESLSQLPLRRAPLGRVRAVGERQAAEVSRSAVVVTVWRGPTYRQFPPRHRPVERNICFWPI